MKPLPLIATIAACTAILAAEIHAESAPDQAAPGRYELKNRSVFRADADARIPFWPIGWKRPKAKADGTPAVAVDEPTVKLQPQSFNISSILLGNPALVTINGRSFSEGEVLPVIYGSQRLRVVVRSIRDGGVWLDHDGQPTFIPMRRPELNGKSPQQKAEPVEFAIKIDPDKP